jgi:hypothetical protein
MKRRLAVRLALSLGLVAALAAAGCSRSGEEPKKPSAVRPLSAIWPEVLAQRDTMQDILGKELEDVTHDDCSALGAAARRVDELTGEILSYVPTTPDQSEGRLRAVGDVIIQMQGVTSKIRESALAEAPGQWIQLRYPLDQVLRAVESYFTPEELGGQSVATRPDFETKPQPAALSPI